MQTPPGIPSQAFRQARNLFPLPHICLLFSAMPWKSGPEGLYQTAITTCSVISFKVTLGYNLILALHSFGIICVSIFQGSFCPAHASYKNSRAGENVSNEAVPPSRAVPGAARPGMHLESTKARRWVLLSLETCAKWTKHSSDLTSAELCHFWMGQGVKITPRKIHGHSWASVPALLSVCSVNRKFLLKYFLFPAVTESKILGKASGSLQEGNRGTGALRFHSHSFCLLLCSHFMIFLRYLWFFSNILLSDFLSKQLHCYCNNRCAHSYN